jgi:hypothetical protein
MIALEHKDRAKELVEKFKNNTRAFNETNGWEDTLHDAKQCALICVDEILKANAIWYVDSIPYKYYMEVKKQIEKL